MASQYSFGPFALDPVERVLLREGTPVHLAPKAFETLLVLLEKQGHLVDKAELLNRVWPDAFVEEATLAQNIFTLRKALGEGTNGHTYIETVPKYGYRFIAPISPAPQAAPRSPEAGPSARTARTLRYWALAAVGALCLLAALWRGWQRFPSSPDPRPATQRLAVIPFENLSGDPSQDYFADGLTEELITKFGVLSPRRLEVIARTTSMQYKNTKKNAAEVARELGTAYIVEGSVVREKDRVRINAQLIRASDQTHVWANSYERSMEGTLLLQNDVATAIVNSIQFKLTAPAQPEHPRGTQSAEAFDAYLQGRFFWNKRTEDGHLKAIKSFEQAIALDRDYAEAYSGLADAYALLGSNPTAAIRRADSMAHARASALKALALNDTLAEAHTSLAFVYWHYDWDWAAAEKEFRRALELNPSYATAHHWYAFFLISQGRGKEALDEIHRAQQIDPLSLIINTDAAQLLCLERDYDGAIRQARKVLEMDPKFNLAHSILLWSFIGKRDYEATSRELENGIGTSSEAIVNRTNLAIGYAALGRSGEAQGQLKQLLADAERRNIGELSVAVAQVYSLLGDRDKAFTWLERDLADRDGGLTLIKVLPFFDSLRDDPRYNRLVRRMGLPQ